MSAVEGVLTEAFVDYITLTTNHPKSTNLLLMKATRELRAQESLGNVVHDWGMAGFRGFSCGQLHAGTRNAEGIVQLSGGYAALEWWEFYQLADACTRCDVQVTVRLDQDVTCFIAKEHKRFKRWKKRHKQRHKIRLVQEDDGGMTCYLGVRKSEVYFRLYNKEVESKLPQHVGCARWEIEFKGDHAKLVVQKLTDGKLVKDTVIATLNEYILTRGGSRLASDEFRQQISCGRQPADVAKALRWLRESVRPSVLMWSERGYRREVIEALGLHDYLMDHPTDAEVVSQSVN